MARSPSSRWPWALRLGRLKGPTVDSNRAAVEGKGWNSPTSQAPPTPPFLNPGAPPRCLLHPRLPLRLRERQAMVDLRPLALRHQHFRKALECLDGRGRIFLRDVCEDGPIQPLCIDLPRDP